jgi:putative hydrolase of the HAD superfamily
MTASWVPQKRDLYLFDVDGVLIRVHEPFSARYEKEIGSPGLMTTFFRGVFQECLVGRADLREEVSRRLRDWKWDGDVEAFLEYWFSAEATINDETLDIIKGLRSRNKICYLVTNQEMYRTKYLTEKLDLDALADGFFSSSMLGVKKPNREFYLEALKRIGFEGDLGMVFYVDDDVENVNAAKELGLDAFYYSA